MWQHNSSFEPSNVLDVTIQCQFNVATKNVMDFSTAYSTPSLQNTCLMRTHTADNLSPCRLDTITPTKATYQCEFEAHQRYYRESVLVGDSSGCEDLSSKSENLSVSSNSVGYNINGSGYHITCLNDSGYDSPTVRMGHDKNYAFSPCVELSRQSESGSPVFENSKYSQVHSNMLSQYKDIPEVNTVNQVNSLVQLENTGNGLCETSIAMRERGVMQSLFSLRSVNIKAANGIEQYYQSQTTAIDIERHNVLCQMAYNKDSADSINIYYNRKLVSLLECVEGKISASEVRKCKGTKCKTNTDRQSRLLPKHAVKLMQNWYDENLENPYPSREVTLSMASDGGVSVEQIRKWFANKRNRSRNSKLKASDIEADDR